MQVVVLRRNLRAVVQELLTLVPGDGQSRFLEQLSLLLREPDETEVEGWLPRLLGSNAEDVVAAASAVLQQIDGPVLLDESRASRPARYVNLCFVADGDRPIPSSRCLAQGRRYQLRIDLGPWSADSIVQNPPRFPDDQMPVTRSGRWLVAEVTSDDYVVDPRGRPFFLPEAGAGWVCSCEPHTGHTCTPQERSPYLYVPVATPPKPGRADLRVTVTRAGGLVQSLAVVTEVRAAEQTGFGTSARVDFTLGGVLDQVADLPPRNLNITAELARHGSHLMTVGGVGENRLSFQLTEDQMDESAGVARLILRKIQEEPRASVRGTRATGATGGRRLAAELARMAPLGRRLFDVLLAGRPEDRAALRRRLRHPASIQIARTGGISTVFPWALVYDIDLEDGNPAAHHTCRIVDHLPSPAPRECPNQDEHGLNTLCPYGFWGIRHMLEQPPSVEGRRTMAVLVRGARPSPMAVGIGTGLDTRLTAAHLERLEELQPSIVASPHRDRATLVEALGRSDLPLIYFYCHGRQEPLPGSLDPVPHLVLGTGERITPSDLTALHGLWGERHWADTSPLVFINSCGSVNITPRSLTQFVDAFVGIYAAGVIGVETAVRQPVAGDVAERFWRSFGAGRSVGEALADVRLSLLGEGTLLGLAYTAYCSAELRLA